MRIPSLRYDEIVKSASDSRPWPEARPLYQAKADMFKGLAHPVRVRVLELLVGVDELPVTTLMAETGLEASHLSQHLGVLRRHGLVVSERRASYVYYRLAHPEVAEFLRSARRLLSLALHDTEARIRASDALPEISGDAGVRR